MTTNHLHVGRGWTILLAASALAWVANAQATRTWVSGVGDDMNACSRTAPCKTFAGAIANTAAGGEIDVLDPGGFGALTITKSITIDGGGGQVGSVLVGGTNGIVVAAASNDVVILRNLRFDGLLGNGTNPGNAGIDGIKFISGAALEIDHCNIFGFNNYGIEIALSASGKVDVSDTTITNTLVGGIRATTTSGMVQLDVSGAHISYTPVGVFADNNSQVDLHGSTLSHNTIGLNQQGSGASTNSNATLTHNTIAFSNVGAQSFTGAMIYATDTNLSLNNTGVNPNGGVILTAGDNTGINNNSQGNTSGVFRKY